MRLTRGGTVASPCAMAAKGAAVWLLAQTVVCSAAPPGTIEALQAEVSNGQLVWMLPALPTLLVQSSMARSGLTR